VRSGNLRCALPPLPSSGSLVGVQTARVRRLAKLLAERRARTVLVLLASLAAGLGRGGARSEVMGVPQEGKERRLWNNLRYVGFCWPVPCPVSRTHALQQMPRCNPERPRFRLTGVTEYLAAAAAAGPPRAAITVTRRCTSSVASDGTSPYWSVERSSIATLRPSIWPSSFKPWRNAATHLSPALLRMPTNGTARCCARAASGHAAAPLRG
jgi:hypothetical protein